MKTQKIIIFTILIIGIVAIVATTRTEKQPVAVAEEVTGQMTLGAEVRTFRLCGESAESWITNIDTVTEAYNTAKTETGSTDPYTAVYAHLAGVFSPQATDGFAADYANQFTVEQVLEVSPLANHPECE